MKKVVLITTGQPSINPRIVKEANALHAAGYYVTMLYCYWIEWANEADKKLLKSVSWNYKLVGGTPAKSKGLYYFTKARFKVNKTLSKKRFNRFLLAERSQARCYDELLRAARSIKADLYIGHNLGALAIAANAASFNKTKAAFDFEDYHREENEGESKATAIRIIYLEEKYVPGLSYISTSSPLITDRVQHNFPSFKKKFCTLLNCFPLSQRAVRKIKAKTDQTLQLFWFSQTVGKNRGLEAVIAALAAINNPAIHLTLAGRVDEGITFFINENAENIKDKIHFAGIIQPNYIPAFAAGFHVGLATELTAPLNRNLCLTNKVFTYLLGGNCILASDTSAQKDFFSRYNTVGLVYKNDDVNDLKEKIQFLFSHPGFIETRRQNSFALASTEFNWEIESKKLLTTISTII